MSETRMITKDGQHEGYVDEFSNEWSKAHDMLLLNIPIDYIYKQIWFHKSNLKLAKTVMDEILDEID